jgi:photosystem II stability/assembly factor-like uncharacterized protein
MLGLAAVAGLAGAADNWVDCSTTLLAGKTGGSFFGVSGVRCNRLTGGDLYMNVVDNGLFKSTDSGQTWSQVASGKISGRCETGWAHDQDQSDPKRLAVFSLDGAAAYTTDGITWKQFANVNRNWDYGSVDWSDPNAQTIIAAEHENGGKVHASANGGTSWTLLSVITNVSGYPDAMVGALGQGILIYSTGTNGINRSTDNGATWTQVSSTNVKTRTPVYFNGKHYLGGVIGLLVSTDRGATWERQGNSVSIYQGPFFGDDENTMVVAGMAGIFRTDNGGIAWTKIADLKPNVNQWYKLADVNYWATYAWDPVNNCAYATAMANHAYRLDLAPATTVSGSAAGKVSVSGLTVANGLVRSRAPMSRIEVFSLSGKLLGERTMGPTREAKLPMAQSMGFAPDILRATTTEGSVETLCR